MSVTVRFFGMVVRYGKAFAAVAFMMLPASARCAPWIRCSPEEAGFQKRGLKELDDFMHRHTGTTGMVIAVNGRIIHTYGNIREVSSIASCRKSVLSMLYGKYVKQGKIRLEATMEELGIDDVGGLLPQEKKATVLDLITARSGVYHPAANPGGIPEGRHYERGATPPGTRFVYNNWDFNVAGTVFSQMTGQSVFRALKRDLAAPLGMEDFSLARHKLSGDEKLSRHLAYHMWFSTRDMARIGQLMLQEGVWNGQQLIPPEWVARSTAITSPLNNSLYCGYGYMWWILRDEIYPDEFRGAFSASGRYGQAITVFPALNMVVAHKSARNAKKPTSKSQYREILRLIMKARRPAPSGSAAQKKRPRGGAGKTAH